jgi:hypothetical protein
MPKMPRLGGSHTLAELEALAHKNEADAQPKEPAPDVSAAPSVPRSRRSQPK